MTRMLVVTMVMFSAAAAPALAADFDQQGDYQTDAFGYYYAITGGQFPNGQTVNGLKPTGGSMCFILDDPIWQSWGYNYSIDDWHKDGWFAETAGLALTMGNQGSVVFDNFNNAAGDFYTVPDGQASSATPGMYRGYSMSNNLDWIYAGYFLLTESTTVDTITGYFDANAGFDPDAWFWNYRMNIWSSVDELQGNGDTYKFPSVDSFTGNVMSSDSTGGTFSWGDTGVDRVFGADYGYQTDDILYLTFTLDTPITLEAGEYWFSHDAIIVPEPATMGLLGLGLAALAARRRK